MLTIMFDKEFGQSNICPMNRCNRTVSSSIKDELHEQVQNEKLQRARRARSIFVSPLRVQIHPYLYEKPFDYKLIIRCRGLGHSLPAKRLGK